jgi:DNA invertase Pin-like site-specific DNA recombinase/ribosomal protein S17E
MMEEIEEGRVNCILCKDLSRLGREYIETGRYLRRVFPAYGVRFIAINDNIDTLNDSGDDLAVSLKSITNDAYCRDISIKTRSALRIKRIAGDYTGAFPVYGYKKDENNRNQLIIDDYPASVVREIFQLKLDGHSSARIADILNERCVLSPIEYKKEKGIPHPKGGYSDKDDAKWSATTIIRILKDEIYIGTLSQGKSGTPNYKLRELKVKPESEWLRKENAHERIIEKHKFDLIQRILALDTRTSPHSNKVYLFSGILVCGCCGNRMTRKTNSYKEEKYHYYYCPTTKKKGCLNSAFIKEEDLTESVLLNLKAHIASVASLDELIKKLDATRIAQELASHLKEQLTENERRLEKIREFKAKLLENMICGNLSKEEHKSLKSKYTDDADALISANMNIQREIDSVLACNHERLMWIEHFKNFSKLDVIDRKTVINLLQCIQVISKTELKIVFNYQDEYENAMTVLRKGVA